MEQIFDIVIIGGGPAGLTAGLYASRARMKAVLIEKAICGGQIILTDRVENFPGFPEGVSGPELGEILYKQASNFGLEVRTDEASGINIPVEEGKPFIVKLASGAELKTLSVIIASGARWNKLGIPGEDVLSSRGVSYCATCDGPMFRNKEVVVVGGGDTALEDAIFLTRFASKVTIVHRRDKLRATKILQERALANKKIELCLNSVAVEIIGKSRVDGIKVSDVSTKAEKVIHADGVFVLIGLTPNSDIAKGLVKLDDKGYIACDDDMKTSAPGIFACGDIRQKLLRQAVTASGDGAVAAVSAQHYVEKIMGTYYK